MTNIVHKVIMSHKSVVSLGLFQRVIVFGMIGSPGNPDAKMNICKLKNRQLKDTETRLKRNILVRNVMVIQQRPHFGKWFVMVGLRSSLLYLGYA